MQRKAILRVFDSLAWIEDQLDELQSIDQKRTLEIRESPHVGGQIQFNGKQLVDFGSNDYLGLSANVKLVDAIKTQAGFVGWGAGASPLISGRGTLHTRLENELAEFKNADSAMLFPTGYAANVGVITSLAGDGDVIFSDEKNHASIIDGCRLSKAKICVFRHNDVEHLSSLISESARFRRKLIVTDAQFSMDGDIARLPQLVDIAKSNHAMLMIDEAHSTGVFGANGRGVAEHFDLESEIDVTVGTFSKALGSHGGFVVGSQKLIDWLANSARSYIFSTACPDASCMATVAAIEIIRDTPDMGTRLLKKADGFRDRLREMGFNVGTSVSQIIPIIIGDNKSTMEMKEKLLNAGYFVPAIRPPAVPLGESMLRISLNAMHSEEMIEEFLAALPGL